MTADPWHRPATPPAPADPAAPFLAAVPAQRRRYGPRDETDLEHRDEWGRAGDEDAALTRYEKHIGR